MYDPTVGRWQSEDPTGFAGGDANLFRYVGNRPTAFTDPSGLKAAPKAACEEPDPFAERKQQHGDVLDLLEYLDPLMREYVENSVQINYEPTGGWWGGRTDARVVNGKTVISIDPSVLADPAKAAAAIAGALLLEDAGRGYRAFRDRKSPPTPVMLDPNGRRSDAELMRKAIRAMQEAGNAPSGLEEVRRKNAAKRQLLAAAVGTTPERPAGARFWDAMYIAFGTPDMTGFRFWDAVAVIAAASPALQNNGRVPPKPAAPGAAPGAGAAPKPGLPATTEASVADKLDRYLLNPDHPVGGPKAKWFKEALGFEKGNAADLAKQIKFDEAKATVTGVTEHGTKYNQVITIQGANGKLIDVNFAWIKNQDGVVRLVTSIPTPK